MQEIQFYCKTCKKSLRTTYTVSGDGNTFILENITIKCSCCKRIMRLKKYTEKMLIESSVDGKFYI